MFHNTLRMKLGKVVKQLRVAAGWSQEQLAEKCGITTVSVSRIENDRHGVGESLLRSLGSVFGLEAHQLMALAEGALPYNTEAAPSSAEEKHLLDNFRRLSVPQRRLYLELGDALALAGAAGRAGGKLG